MNIFEKIDSFNKTVWFNLFSIFGLIFCFKLFKLFYYTNKHSDLSGAGIEYFIIIFCFILSEFLTFAVFLYEPHIKYKLKNNFFTENIFIKLIRYIGAFLNIGLFLHIIYIFIMNK